MGLSPPVFVVLIVLATVVPPLIAGALLSRFVCRNFRDAAGAVKPRPQRRWFGLRRVRSDDSTAAKSLATRAQSYADSWQDLESLRAYRDTPTPSLQYCTSTAGDMASIESEPTNMEFFPHEAEPERPSEIPQPLRVLKRLGSGCGGLDRGGTRNRRRTSAETDESLRSAPEPPDEPLVVVKKRGDPFKYGCIQSLSIQIIPTGSNYILDIIQDNPTQT
ncbi:hypothetical protein CTA1_1791 [Colletotrichum tanaceti]|uniref:Uncharacterized protein n=1 Tax=Colletotrichum tanaceti TaxID=1306861 RepID=A0A4U6XL22_9PEZI|nr:hypothetical protein CTA1_1791 [Colletotrichum tanaceti]